MKRTLMAMIALAGILTSAAGCRHHSAAQRPSRTGIDLEMMKLSKEQLFQRGEEQFARKKFARARSYYTHLYENYPNDPLGRRALLRIADAFYEQGDAVNLVEAQYKYRDFINRYPGSDRADYAMLQIAMCSYKQMERPDRDQQKTREALEKFNDMLKTFPRSELRPEAEKRQQDVLDRMARHEHLVVKYYMKRKSWGAAVQRLNGLVEQYPSYRERDSVFYDFGTSLIGLGRTAEARLYYERVISEFPGSSWAGKARQKLEHLKVA